MTDIGPYELIGWVSQTSASTVWKARDTLLDRFVALKQVVANAGAERLRAEARVLAGLVHPNIVAVLDVVDDGDGTWLVEEWVDAASLDAVRAASGRLTAAQAIGVIRGALQGLSYAHGEDVVHGAVAPGHILVDRDGVSKLIDFGATTFNRAAVGAGNRTGAYAGPEVLAGGRPGKQADVYSAAAVLAELLSGDGAPGPAGGRSITLLASLAPVGRTLERALAPDPALRHPNATALLADLEGAAERSLGAGWLATAGIGGIATGAVATGSLISAEPAPSVAAEPGSSVAPADGVTMQAAIVEPAQVESMGAEEGAPPSSVPTDVVVPDADPSAASAAQFQPVSVNPQSGGGPDSASSELIGSNSGGSGAGAIAPARKVRTRALAIGGGVAATVAIIVAAVVLARGGGSEVAAGNQPGQTTVMATDSGASSTDPSASTETAAPSPPSGSPSLSAIPSGATSSSPTTTPPAGFTGTYSYTYVVNESVGNGPSVGETATNTWTVTAACADLSCPSSVVSSTGNTFEFTWDGESFVRPPVEWEVECVYSDTGQPYGYYVTHRNSTRLTPTIVDGTVVSLTGVMTQQQLDPCLNQDGSLESTPLADATASVTVTRQGP